MKFFTLGLIVGLAILAIAKAQELGVTPSPQYDIQMPQPALDLAEAFKAGGVIGFFSQVINGTAVCDTSEMSERQLRRFLRNGLPRRCRRDYEQNVRDRFEASRQ